MKKPKRKFSELYSCPMCSAMMYPIIKDTPDGELDKSYFCTSCKTDLTPFISAYLEYVIKSGEARIQESNHEE